MKVNDGIIKHKNNEIIKTLLQRGTNHSVTKCIWKYML